MATATDEPEDLNLPLLAAQWIQEVSEHRAGQRVYGKVSAGIVTTPDGSEIHLTEETTFKAAKGQPCPLAQALNWLRARDADRKKNRQTGGGKVEYDQRAGEVTWAKVIETTIKSVSLRQPPLDVTRKPK